MLSQVVDPFNIPCMKIVIFFIDQGYEACGYIKWLDDEWQGRAGSVIVKLVEDNGNLKMKVTDQEGTIKGLKQELINHIKQKKGSDKKELACVVVVASFAICYALFALMIRGFV